MLRTLLFAGIISCGAFGALAHSPLNATIPVDQAVLEQAPTELVLDFRGAVRLTRLTMTLAGSESTDLDLSEFDGFISEYSVQLPGMASGDYTIEWRGLADDGHAQNGTFTFNVL